MGNNPISNADPEGDLFFAIPQISFNGGFSVGLEVGFGVPGVASISATGMVGANSSWSVQGRAGGLYAGYGSNGAFAGVGYQWSGFNAGYDFVSGTASVGYGGGFGNGHAASVGLSYGKGGFGFSAGASSTYMWGTMKGVGHSSDGNGSLEQSDGSRVRGNTGLYTDETEAYNVMWEQSVSEGVETAGWLTDDGVLVSPIEYSDFKNTYNASDNRYFTLSWKGKTMYAHHNGNAHRVLGQIHTHPKSNRGLSTGGRNTDQGLQKYVGYGSVYAIAQKNLYRGYHVGGKWYSHSFGLRANLLNGKIKLIP